MPSSGGDLLQRALDAQLRYYAEVGRLTVEYLETLGDLSRTFDLKLPGTDRTFRWSPSDGGSAARESYAPPPPQPAAEATAVASPPASPAIVLEGEAGGTATGLFLVENSSSERVASPIAASVFTSSAGGEVQPKLGFEPEIVSLEPGEQLLVHLTAAIDDDLEEGVGYRGALRVPGLQGTEVAIVLRRRAAAASGES
ncbi:MAG TPA: hypothetical protein VF526_12595 [Solirubrobacteraceae bacterium]|jgi:hypothetical protein